MFTSKQKRLMPLYDTVGQASVPVEKNSFLDAGKKKAARTYSGNGAVKYSTTGNEFVDQFSKTGLYKAPRPFAEIQTDMSTLWAKNPRLTVMITLFFRTITRVVSLFDGTKTTSPQRGSGLKYESIMRMLWIAVNHPETFYKNIALFITVGSWKDIITMMSYDLQYNGWNDRKLDWDKLSALLIAGLENPNTSELVKKYLPQIKATKKARTLEAQADTIIAKFIASKLFGNKKSDGATYKQYRLLKSKGTAHTWQQLISRKKLLDINFDTIHGRALAQLVSGKFLSNNGLEKRYEAWIAAKPVAKFTGYVHELFEKVGTGWGVNNSLKKYQIDTINAQFRGLVETAKKNAVQGTSLIVVRDTSSSMTSECTGTKMSAYSIGKALALFFSEMLPAGKFANAFIEFAGNATLHTWKGSTPFEKFINDRSEAYGSTNLQSVIDLFVQIKSTGVRESEFPTGILCISDGEFNPTRDLKSTNVQAARMALGKAGFSKDYIDNFKMIFWNLQTGYYGKTTGQKFETYGETENVYYFGGYDGAILAFLTGTTEKEKPTPKTDVELFEAAMDQQVLNMVEV